MDGVEALELPEEFGHAQFAYVLDKHDMRLAGWAETQKDELA